MPDETLKVMRCLEDELKSNPSLDNKSYGVLLFLVKASIKALEKGDGEPQTFDRPALLSAIAPEKANSTDPARWIKLDMLNKYLDARMVSLLARLDRAGLDMKPVVKANEATGGKSNQRVFWLDVEPIALEDRNPHNDVDFEKIYYERSEAAEIKPSWFLRLLFPKGELKTRSRQGYALLTLYSGPQI